MQNENIRGKTSNFNSLKLHDSEINGIHIVRNPDKTYTITLNVTMLGKRIEGKYERYKINLIFKKCVFFATNINFVFLSYCKGAISTASFYENFSSMEAERQEVFWKYLNDRQHLLEVAGWYFFEFLQPGGEMLIGSAEFEIENLE